MSRKDRRPATRSKGDPSGQTKGRGPAGSVRGASSAASALAGLSQPATAGSPNHAARAGMARDLQGTLGNQATAAVAGGGGLSYKVNLPSTGGGEPLPAESRAQFEGAMGADLSDVRVHQDGQPEKLGTRAFTMGSDVHVERGTDPATDQGRRILGHELAHVVQQREGRIQGDGRGTRLTEDPALEHEADVIGKSLGNASSRADESISAEGPAAAPAQAPGGVVQGVWPALAAIGSWLAEAATAQAATSVGAILAVGAVTAQAGASIAPGSTGVQEVQLENGWMSNADTKKLELIVQYRIINAYVAKWIETHGGEPEPDVVGPPAPAPAPAPGPTNEPPTGSPTTDAIDEALIATVATDIALQIQELLNANQREGREETFVWSDSGDHSEDTFGTVGAVTFTGMKGSNITETLALSAEASQIPNLKPARLGEVMLVEQFRGGRLIRGAPMETGMNDDLAINLVGGAPTIDQGGDDGHGIHIYDTSWNWDDNTTYWAFELKVAVGTPYVMEQPSRGDPED